MELRAKYGGIFTFWIASQPFVVIADAEISKEALTEKKNDLINRPTIRSIEHMKKYVTAIIMEPAGKKWEVTRKVGAGAVRKFADSEKLAIIVKEATDKLTEKLLKIGKPFNPTTTLHVAITNIIACTAFGLQSLTEEESLEIEYLFDKAHEQFGSNPGDVSNLLHLLYYKKDLAIRETIKDLGKFVTTKHKKNQKNFQRGEIRNFSDAVLTSALEAEEEDKESKEFLTDDNLCKIMGDLFVAGVDTTASALSWIIFLLGNFPDMQNKVRNELKENVRDENLILQSDGRNCPYTWAFISETLRYRTPAPIGVLHSAIVDTEIAGYKIRKGTTVLFHLDGIQHNPNTFEKPEQFKPERFLNEDGSLNKTKIKGFIPFSEGKRVCIGEKLARNDLFILIANLLLKVKISLDVPPGTADLVPEEHPSFQLPKDHRVIISPIF